MIRLALSIASPAGPRGRLSILMFHRVVAEADPLFPELPTAAEFEQRMLWVKSWFNVMPLERAAELLFAGSIPSRALAITFDDGYGDNEQIAAPILHRLGLTATFFISTGYLGGGCMWNDQVIESIRGCRSEALHLPQHGLGCHRLDSNQARRRAIDSILGEIKRYEPALRQSITAAIVEATGRASMPTLMMNPAQVLGLRALGMGIGAHTVTHPILARLSPADALSEMSRSKQALESLLGEPVTLFAYPNGVPVHDYGAEHTTLARECGFKAAVTTAWGAGSIRSDRYQLPRFTPWDRTPLRYGLRLVANIARRPALA